MKNYAIQEYVIVHSAFSPRFSNQTIEFAKRARIQNKTDMTRYVSVYRMLI